MTDDATTPSEPSEVAEAAEQEAPSPEPEEPKPEAEAPKAERPGEAEGEGKDEEGEEKKKKKKKGPIRFGMILPALIFVLVAGVGIYLRRNPIIFAGVVHGGRAAFQSDVSLVKVESSIDWKEAKVDLSDLQVPDRGDLSRNALQAGEVSAAMSTADLFRGTVHVEHVRAKELALFAPRPEPAKALPGAPPPEGPLGEDDEGALGELGDVLKAFDVKDIPFEEVMAALDLQTVAYVKGFRSRQEDREAKWKEKLAGYRGELLALQKRSKELVDEATPLAKSMQSEWDVAYDKKRKDLAALRQRLEKDPNALGGNPAVEIPKRVKKEVAELDAVRESQAGRAKEIKAKRDVIQAEVAKVAAELESLERDGKLASKELDGEVTKARKALDADKKKIAAYLDPSEEQIEELLSVLFGPEVVDQIRDARRTIAILQKLLPHETERRTAPPKTPREGQVFEFPRLAADGSVDPVGRVKLLVDELDLSGKLYLPREGKEDRVVSLEGKAQNLSDAPRRCGRQLTFDLTCEISDGEQRHAFQAGGGFDPVADATTLVTTWKDYRLDGLVLREGDPEPSDPFPRTIEEATVDVKMMVTSGKGLFRVSIDATLHGVKWGSLPPAEEPIVQAVRRAVSSASELQLAVKYVQDEKGSKLTVADPGLRKALAAELEKFVQEEVDKAVAKHSKSLEQNLDQEVALARKELTASRQRLDAELEKLGGVEQELQAALSSSDLDRVISGMDRAKESLTKDATADLLEAATKGKLKIPKLPGGLFGND